jgi:hypothetical protein
MAAPIVEDTAASTIMCDFASSLLYEGEGASVETRNAHSAHHRHAFGRPTLVTVVKTVADDVH